MSKYGRREAGTPLNEQQRAELRVLSELPDSEIDYSDIPERTSREEGLPLKPHTVTLWVDADVAAWLEKAGERDARRINLLLKRESGRVQDSSVSSSSVLHHAS